MATICIRIVVSNLDKVMEQFDQIKVHRSTTGITGPYSEITTPPTRIALVADTITYEYTDTAGDADYYYKVSYYNSVSTAESSLSDAQQGDGAAALSVISVEEVKTNYLFGLDLTDDEGNEFPDSMYEFFIKSAVSWLEHKFDIPITPTSYEEDHDFYRQEYRKHMRLQLDHYPVISIEEIKMHLPPDQDIITFDSSWIKLFKEHGEVHIIPGTGSASVLYLGQGTAWSPFGYRGNDMLPGVFQTKYTAGFPIGQVPAVIRDLVGKTASFGPLNIAGDLLGGAGIASQSISLDGLSQSFNTTSSATNAGYGARLLQYQKEIKIQMADIRRYYKGFQMQVA